MPLYRIAWKTGTGFEGYGDSISYADASAWVDYLNQQYTGADSIHHWIETIQVAHCRPDSAARGPDTHT